MTWLVFGVSCLLVLAGAVSIISGAPIIQLERGWAEVISGTVALSSGGVVFALAGILMRLESIRDTVAAQALPVAAEAVSRPAPISIAEKSDAAPVSPPPEPAVIPVSSPEKPGEDVVPPPAVEEDGRTEGLWKRVKRPDVQRPAAEQTEPEALRQHGFPDRVLPDEPPPSPPAAETPVVVPAHPVPAEVPVPTVETTPAETSEREATPTERDAGQIGWLERSLFRGRTSRPGEDVPAPSRPEPSLEPRPFPRSADREARKEPSLSSTDDRPAARAPLFPAPEPSAAAEPAPTPDLASEQHGGATVIGRYQAGSASYVMYSDGTIEVETESGEIHRFGSMDELKAFIAQQDTPVS